MKRKRENLTAQVYLTKVRQGHGKPEQYRTFAYRQRHSSPYFKLTEQLCAAMWNMRSIMQEENLHDPELKAAYQVLTNIQRITEQRYLDGQ
jgi:hypothetical protein